MTYFSNISSPVTMNFDPRLLPMNWA